MVTPFQMGIITFSCASSAATVLSTDLFALPVSLSLKITKLQGMSDSEKKFRRGETNRRIDKNALFIAPLPKYANVTIYRFLIFMFF